jgi:hypothetical protein
MLKVMSSFQEFALIFRPTRPLDPKDLTRRNAAAREWALTLHREGVLAHAAPLESEGVRITEEGSSPPDEAKSIGAVLVIRAKDLAAAAALSKTHPSLPYGIEIEVRLVKAVVLADQPAADHCRL